MSNRKMSIAVIISYIIMLLVNIFANVIPLNGMQTSDVSDKYNTLFTPIGFTFVIWVFIYILLGMYTYYQYNFYVRYRHSTDRVMQRVNLYFLMSNLLNALWIMLWHYEWLVITLIVMVLLLVLLIQIRQVIARRSTLNPREKKYLLLPFSIYFGWITVALIANISSVLVYLKWNEGSINTEKITLVILILGFLIAYMTMMHFMDIPYSLIIVWAYIGILIRHITVLNKEYTLIIVTLGVTIVLLIMGILQIYILKNRRRH